MSSRASLVCASASVRPSEEKSSPPSSCSGGAASRRVTGFDEQDGRGVVLDRQSTAVGADRVGVRAVARAGQDADRGGVAQQLGEQRAARGDRIVESRARAGEQQPVVDAVVGQRLGAEALGVGDDRRASRGGALGERHAAGHDRSGQQHGDAGHRRPQPAVGAALAVGLVGGVGTGGRDELVLERVQVARVGVAPVRRGSEPRAAIELCGIAAARGPIVRGARQVGVQPAALGIRLDPGSQPGPLAQQRLVRHFRHTLVQGDQPALAERRQRGGGVRVALEVELGEGNPAADEGNLVAGLREPQKNPPRRLRLARTQAGVGLLGKPGDGPAHAAAALVGGRAQRAPVALPPQLDERRRKEREPTGLARHVGDERIGELRLDRQPRERRRALDGPPQLFRAHRADQHLAGGRQRRQLRVRRAASVVVGPQREQHERAGLRGRHQRVEERHPLGLVATRGERLLELIHGDHQPLRPGRLPQRPLEQRRGPLARAQQRLAPAVGPRERAAGQRRQQPRAQGRGLAAARRPDDHEQRRAGQPRDELAEEPLAP